MLHEKYFNPEWSTNGAQLYGLSPLKTAVKRYTRNNEAMTAASVAFKNQGVKGFISPDISPQDEEQDEQDEGEDCSTDSEDCES